MLCDKKFASKSTLNNHRKLHSDPEFDKRRQQEEPGYHIVTEHPISLRDHTKRVQLDTGEKGLKCMYCDYTTRQPGPAYNHVRRVHFKIHPFVCMVCGSKFDSRVHLRDHMGKHSGQPLHHCEVCGKNFVMQRLLKEHMRIHSGQKNFECPQCGKKFLRSSELSRHKKVHAREVPVY